MNTFKHIALLFLSVAIGLYVPCVAMAAEVTDDVNTLEVATYSCPDLREAQAAIVCDEQGSIIFGKNIDAQFNMASITKIMTAVCALENGFDLSGQVTCVGSVLDENAQLAGFTAGQIASSQDLWNAMLVFSANDAAYEIACNTAGSEEAFVAMMNTKASELGMTHTVFKNCHGLDAEGHCSSCSDLIKLARYALVNHPEIVKAVSCESTLVTIGDTQITLESTDQLLASYAGAMGIKTGMGNNTTCFLGAARRSGLTLYSCVLGCSTSEGRFADTKTLLDAAFNSYYKPTVFASRELTDDTSPFAYHFGWSVQTKGECTTRGYVNAGAGKVKRINLTPYNQNELLDTNTQIMVSQWSQNDRTVATSIFSTSSDLIRSRSGFGIAGKLLNNSSLQADVQLLLSANESSAADSKS